MCYLILRLSESIDCLIILKKTTDERVQILVLKTYNRLSTHIQSLLELRNLLRFKKGDLTFQYLEPKWLTNSIHA